MQVLIDGIGLTPASWSAPMLTELSEELVAAAEMHKFAGPEVAENGDLVMAITLIAESHIALHLNRATAVANVDVFSCKAVPPAVIGLVIDRLNLRSAHVQRVERVEL